VPQLFELQQGTGPVLVNVPHAGTHVPLAIADALTAKARGLPDTDWFVDELYGFAPGLGAGLMVATHSRYVVDLNRPPDDSALYATRGTGLVPDQSFAGETLYLPGHQPDSVEVSRRIDEYWAPYHAALDAELERLRRHHGYAILLDGHSIVSRAPLLFAGRLPDLNLGSNGGASAHSDLVSGAMRVLGSTAGWSVVLDGRFRGGHITRHYGRPAEGRHALQLEMAQCVYMQESPPRREREAMQRLSDLLRRLVGELAAWKPPA